MITSADHLLPVASYATWLVQNYLERGYGTLGIQDAAFGIFLHSGNKISHRDDNDHHRLLFPSVVPKLLSKMANVTLGNQDFAYALFCYPLSNNFSDR